MYHSIDSFTVDEDKCLTPFRVTKRGKQIKSIYSDHCALTTQFNILHKPPEKINEKRWAITPDGLEKFRELTDPPFYQVEEGSDPQLNYNMFSNKITQTMGKCFKEKTMNMNKEAPSGNKKIGHLIQKLTAYKKRGKAQRSAAMFLIDKMKEIQMQNVSKENLEKVRKMHEDFTDEGKFSKNQFWKLRKFLTKSKESKTSVLVDNVEIIGEESNRNAYRDEFIHRLRNRTISPELEEYQLTIETLVKEYLKHAEEVKEQPDFTMDELIAIIKSLASKKSPGEDKITTDLLKAAGKGLLQAILDLFNNMKNKFVIPVQWELVIIKTLYKGKGKKKELVNYRGIFLTSTLCKVFEKQIIIIIFSIITKLHWCGSRSRVGDR